MQWNQGDQMGLRKDGHALHNASALSYIQLTSYLYAGPG